MVFLQKQVQNDIRGQLYCTSGTRFPLACTVFRQALAFRVNMEDYWM